MNFQRIKMKTLLEYSYGKENVKKIQVVRYRPDIIPWKLIRDLQVNGKQVVMVAYAPVYNRIKSKRIYMEPLVGYDLYSPAASYAEAYDWYVFKWYDYSEKDIVVLVPKDLYFPFVFRRANIDFSLASSVLDLFHNFKYREDEYKVTFLARVGSAVSVVKINYKDNYYDVGVLIDFNGKAFVHNEKLVMAELAKEMGDVFG